MDDLPEQNESDIRKRAAWLLFMLAVVAALFVTLFLTVFNNSGSNNTADNNDFSPSDAITTPAPTSTASSPTGSPSGSPSGSTSASGSPSGSTSGTPTGSASSTATTDPACPTGAACAFPTDIGNGIAAVAAYRAQHNQSAVPVTWSAAAAQCALANGSGCSGGWAVTQLSKPDGTAAVKKIAHLAKFDSSTKSIEIGWAYDPAGKNYYFATIRNS